MVVRDVVQYVKVQKGLVARILENTGASFSREALQGVWRALSEEDLEKLGERVSQRLHITCDDKEIAKILESNHLSLRIKLKVGVKNYDSGEERVVGEEEVSYCLSSQNKGSCEYRQIVQGAIPICSLEGTISNGVPDSLSPESLDRKVVPEVDFHKYFMSEKAKGDVGFVRGIVDYFDQGYGEDFLRRHVDAETAGKIVRNAFGDTAHASVLFSSEFYLVDRNSGNSVKIDALDFNCCVNGKHPDCKFKQKYDVGLPECKRDAKPLDFADYHLDGLEVETATPAQL